MILIVTIKERLFIMKLKKILLLFISVSMLTSTAFAFNFGLTSNKFSSKKGSHQSLLLSNPGKSFVAIELAMLTRTHNENGAEVNEEVDDEFMVYPSMVLLKPNSDQVISIKWMGEENIETEKAYRLSIEEVPIDRKAPIEQEFDGGTKASVMVLRKFLKSIYVMPNKEIEKIVINKFETEKNVSGNNIINIEISNQGTIHKLLENTKIKVVPVNKQENKYKFFTPEEFRRVNLLTGETRTVTIDWPENIPQENHKVNIIFKHN